MENSQHDDGFSFILFMIYQFSMKIVKVDFYYYQKLKPSNVGS